MERKLADIRRRGAQAEKRARKEDAVVAEMEAAAMASYKKNDLMGSGDLTAAEFHKRREERDRAAEAAEEAGMG